MILVINYQTINIPAYLVPLCSELVGIGFARQGGGFDLIQSYSRKENNCVLILLSDKIHLLENEKLDHIPEEVEEYFLSYSGRFTFTVAILDSIDSKEEAYNKIILALTVILWFLGSHGPGEKFDNAKEIVEKQVISGSKKWISNAGVSEFYNMHRASIERSKKTD